MISLKQDSQAKLQIIEDENKYLVKSSDTLFFLSIYAYFKGAYFYSFISMIQFIIAKLFWTHLYIFLRTLDVWTQTVGMSYLFIRANIFTNSVFHTMIGNMFIVISMINFYLSCNFFEKRKIYWYKYHLLFHIFGLFAGIFGINAVTK